MASKKLLFIPLIIAIVLFVGLASATITSYSGLSPADATTTGDKTPDFTFTAVSDINDTFSCELFVNDTSKGSNASVINDTSTTITSTELSDGTYTWYVNCTDVNGTFNSTPQTITVDTSISIIAPSANSWHDSDFTINVTSTADTVEYQYQYANGTNSSWTSLSNTSATAWNATFDVSAVADGNYTIRINATTGGTSNTNETVFIYIDDTAPSITSFTQTKMDTITVGESISASDFDCDATDNSESFGGSVDTSITGFETGTTGSHTATCTATDSAENTDTATVDYTVYSGGTSNGGGTTTEPSSTEVISKIEPGEVAKFTNIDSDIGIEEICVEVNETATSVKISARRLINNPASEEVPETVYRYLKITTTNLDNDNIKSAVIEFKVDKDWLEDNSVNQSSIIMYRWDDGKWNALSTKRTAQDSNYIYYEAETPGFSYFAVAGEISLIAAEDLEEVPAGKTITTQESVAQTGAYIAVILIIIMGIAVYYFVFRKPPKQGKPSRLSGKYVKIKLKKK